MQFGPPIQTEEGQKDGGEVQSFCPLGLITVVRYSSISDALRGSSHVQIDRADHMQQDTIP
jgi:hypothetical protein